MSHPYMQRPCQHCPFRTDCQPGWLGGERVAGILEQSSFVCHKTTGGNDKDRRQCAGHMIIKGEKNDFVATARMLKIPLNLKGKDLVFETESQCIEHHE